MCTVTTFRTEYSGGTNSETVMWFLIIFYYLDCTKCKFPDISLTFLNIHFFPDLQQNSLTFPWLLPSLEFPWLFPDRWTPWMYFVGSNLDWYSVSATAMMYSIACHIGPCYNGTRLYVLVKRWLNSKPCMLLCKSNIIQPVSVMWTQKLSQSCWWYWVYCFRPRQLSRWLCGGHQPKKMAPFQDITHQ